MADQPNPDSSWTSWHTIAVFTVVTISYGALVWYVIWGLHGAYSVEGTRLLLVLTLTIAMFGFGGLLIFKALYPGTSENTLPDRFRLAREIFLVFSGIFGTIIGFYFGTSDTQDKVAAPTVDIAFANGQVTAAVTGGAEPFIGMITPKGAGTAELMTADKRVLSYKSAACPDGAAVLVVDGRGQRADGVVKCGSEPPVNPQDNGAAPESNAAANNAAGNG